MIARLRAWWEETHGAGLELVRHFLARFFDSELVSISEGWLKAAIGLLATLLSVGFLGATVYYRRYNNEQSPAFWSAQVYREWIRADVLSFVAVAMAVTALVTLLHWQSLFPSLRDCLALAGLPVRARHIFQAKFSALLLLFSGFTLAMTGPPAVLFAMVASGRWQENPSALANVAANFSATAGACVFVFFGLLAVQGILLNVLPGRIFARVSLIVQGALFIATLGALPLLGRQPATAEWWPPVWFLRLWEAVVTGPPGAAHAAALAIVLAAVIAVVAYLVSYRRYQRLLLEAPPDRAERRADIGAWLLERWIRDPREQAAFAFTWKTLARSHLHRLILLACAGLALGWITKGVVDTPRPTLRDQGMYGLAVVLIPLALSMLATAGLRYVFSLPVALRSNWVFQTIDREGCAAWLGAVERFVLWCGIAPIFLASLPAAVAILGGVRAAAAGALTFLAALVWFEALFWNWRKLPFTCAHLPGKQPLWFTLLRYGLVVGFLAPAGRLILASSREPAAFVALFSLLAVLVWRLRARRRAAWSQCALVYEEAAEEAVMALGLQSPPESRLASLEARPTEPAGALFSDSLVESRGRLPEAWAEEIKEERRHPFLLLATLP